MRRVNSVDSVKLKLAVLISFSGAGGVERMVMNLVREFAKHCNTMDLLVIRAKGPHFDNIPSNVRVIHLNANHTLTAIPEIRAYLKNENPASMLVAKDRAGRAAIIARWLAGVNTKIVVRLGTNLSTALKHRSQISAWWRTAPMKKLYPKIDKIVAVSEGVAEDTVNITGIDKNKICVIRNPVVTHDFFEKAAQPAPHVWLEEKKEPVIIGVGRLSVQKDFDLLIRAFEKVNRETPVKLIILGDGGKRQELETLVSQLGIQDRVAMPGFQSNPMCWVRYADLFVLSSRWEGSPNALTEALALGVPSVSTRCPSGPNETLHEGKYGPLVDVGNLDQMVEAMIHVLNHPHAKTFLQEAVKEYHAQYSAKRYLSVLQGES